jgi:hypothetical protein
MASNSNVPKKRLVGVVVKPADRIGKGDRLDMPKGLAKVPIKKPGNFFSGKRLKKL